MSKVKCDQSGKATARVLKHASTQSAASKTTLRKSSVCRFLCERSVVSFLPNNPRDEQHQGVKRWTKSDVETKLLPDCRSHQSVKFSSQTNERGQA